MTPKFIFFVAINVVIFNVNFSLGQNITISIPDGQIKGTTEVTKANYTFYSFSGVRYAQPPVGNLRFKSPLPVEPWDGVYDATYEKNFCFQTSGDNNWANEDCLFLNIHTPDINGSLPVMTFIHGGGFVDGGGGVRGGNGPDFFMEYEVILVTINYRLGPFGFSSTNDMVIPGNAGLKDQTLALEWIQQNIKYFGGDPSKVTIFGESAGSASVSYHLISRKSAGLLFGDIGSQRAPMGSSFLHITIEPPGLFRAAILESGSALSAWAYQRDQRDYTFRTATNIDPNFTSNSSDDLLTFLLNASASDIHEASKKIYNTQSSENLQIQHGFFYSPVIEPDHEDAFINQSMFESFQNGDIITVPTIIGINAEEGLMVYNSLFQNYVEALNNNEALLVPDNMHINDDNPNKTIIINAIQDFYNISKDRTYEEQLPGTLRYLTDHCFARSSFKQAQLQARFSDVYFYVFSYDGELGNNDVKIPGTGNVSHGEEVTYLFAPRTLNSGKVNVDLDLFPESDRITHNRLMKLWVNFATTLNPTPEPDALFHYITWPTVDYITEAFEYLDINTDLSLKANPRWEAYTLWEDLYQKYAVEPLDGY